MFTDSRRKRRRKNRLMTVGIIGMVLAMIVYGYNMSRAQVREQAAAQTPTPRVSVMLPSASPNIPAMVDSQQVLSEHATVVLKTKYLGCGHTKDQELSVQGIAGMTQSQFAALYPQCVITTFSPTRVEMTRELDGVCSKHYVLKQEGSALVIYQRDTDDSWRKVQNIEDFVMPYKDKELEKGIVFDSLQQIESFLESIEE